VIAEEGAVIGSSTVIGYDSKGEVRFEGPSSMIFPMGTSVEAPAFVPGVDETGLELGCSVMFLPALLAQGSQALVFRPRLDTTGAASDSTWRATAEDLSTGDAGVLGSGLHPVDWVQHPVDTTVRKLRGREVVEELVPSERYIISLGGRALDFQAIVPTLHHVTWLLKTAIEYDHYSPVNQTRTEAAWRERCRPDELKLLQWATSKEAPSKEPTTKEAPAPRRPLGRGPQEA